MQRYVVIDNISLRYLLFLNFSELTEDSILENLRLRFSRNVIYVSRMIPVILTPVNRVCLFVSKNEIELCALLLQTFIGNILVAVNPYRMFPQMYNLDAVKAYENYIQLTEHSPP